ncbi:glycosyltransferase family 4 protein [archaeon]|jgi:glycosyltransferase involved in cell wall biosynthesis|nr:glycosyltransferase family 4 protein [archaeon]
MNMKILLLSEFFPDSKTLDITGGVEARAYFLAKELSIKNEVYVLTSRRKSQKKLDKIEKINILRIGPIYSYSNYGNLLQRIFFSLSCFFSIRRIVKKYSIDVIDTLTYFTYPVILRNIKAKKFLTYHEVWIGEWVKNTGTKLGLVGEIAERVILFFVKITKTKIISVSEFTRKKLVEQGIKKVNVVNNGIDMQKYDSVKVSKFDFPTIGVIGRLINQKRVDDVLYALAIVKKKIPDIKLKIIGKGEEMKSLKKLTIKLHLEKNVEFLGYVKEHMDVIKTLKKCHLFVHASIREGFGIVLLESAACGIPFVATDIEPFIEVTKKGKGGMIFKKKNYYDLADKILEILKNKKKYGKKVEECSELAMEYNWDEIAEKLVRVYRK